MATTSDPRNGRDCLWPRAWLCLQASGPLPAALADQLGELDPELQCAAGEALLDITHAQRDHGPPERIAARLAGLVCDGGLTGPIAIGVAATAWVARHAARTIGQGLAVIPPWELRRHLHDLPLARAAPLDPLLVRQLAHAGIRSCSDLADWPADAVTRRFGAAGQRLWLAVRGREPAEPEARPVAGGTLTICKVLPPRTLSARTLETYLRSMCRRLDARLRRHDLRVGRLRLQLRYGSPAIDHDSGIMLAGGLQDGDRLYRLVRARFRQGWSGQAVARLQVLALDLENNSGQLELFSAEALGVLCLPSPLDRGARGSMSPEAAAPAPLHDAHRMGIVHGQRRVAPGPSARAPVPWRYAV